MKKQSKQIIVNAIVKEIENGVERGKCLAKIVKKWQISDRTFDRYWKTANIIQKERQDKAREAADKVYIETQAEAAKMAVMSKQERLEFLTKIVKAKTNIKTVGKIPMSIITHEDGTMEIINLKDKLIALAEMNKMDGSYAPSKVAQTDTQGKDIPMLNFKPASILQPQEIETLTANEGS